MPRETNLTLIKSFPGLHFGKVRLPNIHTPPPPRKRTGQASFGVLPPPLSHPNELLTAERWSQSSGRAVRATLRTFPSLSPFFGIAALFLARLVFPTRWRVESPRIPRPTRHGGRR